MKLGLRGQNGKVNNTRSTGLLAGTYERREINTPGACDWQPGNDGCRMRSNGMGGTRSRNLSA